MFDPGLKIGQVVKNSDIVETFKCSNMGGMRRSKATNTLVIVSDYTKGLYYDKWIGGVLHYTGMGKSGDQDISWAQNATLAGYGKNNVDIHLFEVIDPGEYVYCGRIELVDKPYTETQPGEDGVPRKVWMFPIRPVPENDVKKPAMFVFSDMDDYLKRGANVNEEYTRALSARKKSRAPSSPSKPSYIPPKPEPKPAIVIPPEIVGKTVKHKSFGVGVIIEISGTTICVDFKTVGKKQLRYDICMTNKFLEFV